MRTVYREGIRRVRCDNWGHITAGWIRFGSEVGLSHYLSTIATISSTGKQMDVLRAGPPPPPGCLRRVFGGSSAGLQDTAPETKGAPGVRRAGLCSAKEIACCYRW